MRPEDVYKLVLHIEDESIKIIGKMREDSQQQVSKALKAKESEAGLPEAVWGERGMMMSIPTNVVAYCGTVERYEAMVTYYTFRAWVYDLSPDDTPVDIDNVEVLDELCDGLLQKAADFGNHKRYHDYYERWKEGKELMEIYRSFI